jgi:hypothetical protein
LFKIAEQKLGPLYSIVSDNGGLVRELTPELHPKEYDGQTVVARKPFTRKTESKFRKLMREVRDALQDIVYASPANAGEWRHFGGLIDDTICRLLSEYAVDLDRRMQIILYARPIADEITRRGLAELAEECRSELMEKVRHFGDDQAAERLTNAMPDTDSADFEEVVSNLPNLPPEELDRLTNDGIRLAGLNRLRQAGDRLVSWYDRVQFLFVPPFEIMKKRKLDCHIAILERELAQATEEPETRGDEVAEDADEGTLTDGQPTVESPAPARVPESRRGWFRGFFPHS